MTETGFNIFMAIIIAIAIYVCYVMLTYNKDVDISNLSEKLSENCTPRDNMITITNDAYRWVCENGTNVRIERKKKMIDK